MSIFDGIDFDNLPEGFNEECVREEIITPLLKLLGYSTFDKSKCIVRGPHLQHPFIQFGTKKYGIEEIPDYLIKVNGENAFIIEAKSPSKKIHKGRHVEQAYSYAINREIQTKKFVLCNGKEISVFDVNKYEPVLYFGIAKASKEEWEKLFELISPMAFSVPYIFDFMPDYGLWCLNNGMSLDTIHYFTNCFISDVAKLNNDWFSFIATIPMENEEFMASFDCPMLLFEDFMKQVPDAKKEIVRSYMTNAPFKYQANTKEESFGVKFSAVLSEKVIKNENEDYLPLIVNEFIEG